MGGNATGTYRLLNGFYVLTDMPATFQKVIDVTLKNCRNKFAYLGDILVITKGTVIDHEKLDKVLHSLDKENLAIKLQKCEFAKTEIIWLDLKITPTGIISNKNELDKINKLEPPRLRKQLRSFMRCIHHLKKFTPKIAELSESLRPQLSKNKTKAQIKLDWKDQHTRAFEEIKKQVANQSENKHFDISRDTRVN